MRVPRFNPTLILAIAVLALALSGTALAASASKIVIQGGTSPGSVKVTKEGQLLTTEMPVQESVNIFHSISNGICTTFYKVPPGKSLVVRSMIYYVALSSGSPGQLSFSTGPPCGSFTGLAGYSATSGTVQESFPGGYVIHTGTLSSEGAGASGSALISGYLVPAAVVAGTRNMIQRMNHGVLPSSH
ncbi:MAG TPA: hypothetical protein VG815_21795 [Chloroflexota bacterium]|nr:hypothetical protein [Chloroflexota bacterium]